MKLNDDTKRILDKMYNLRGNDSTILIKIDEDAKNAEETKKRTEKEKQELEKTINNLAADEKLLADQGAKLKEVLKSIKREDFATVLDKLDIDFNPDAISHKVNETLPSTIEKVVSEKKESEAKLVTVNKEMNTAITEIEELSIRKDEALSDQNKLNEYFKLSLAGNINITRDSITTLLEKFKFDEVEQREAAKILMFPEDALFDYDKTIKNEPVIKAEKEQEEIIQEQDLVKDEPLSSINDVIKTELPIDIRSENSSEVKKETTKDDIKELLQKKGFKGEDFTNQDLNAILANYNEKVLNENVDYVDSLGINEDIFTDNVEFITDKELKPKIDRLIEIGKAPFDIYLNPNILMKYNLEELNHAISSLTESGLDPKKVPLMAF